MCIIQGLFKAHPHKKIKKNKKRDYSKLILKDVHFDSASGLYAKVSNVIKLFSHCPKSTSFSNFIGFRWVCMTYVKFCISKYSWNDLIIGFKR